MKVALNETRLPSVFFAQKDNFHIHSPPTHDGKMRYYRGWYRIGIAENGNIMGDESILNNGKCTAQITTHIHMIPNPPEPRTSLNRRKFVA